MVWRNGTETSCRWHDRARQCSGILNWWPFLWPFPVFQSTTSYITTKLSSDPCWNTRVLFSTLVCQKNKTQSLENAQRRALQIIVGNSFVSFSFVRLHVKSIWTLSCDNSDTVRDRMPVSINHYSLIGSSIRAFDWYRPRWPWMTLCHLVWPWTAW